MIEECVNCVKLEDIIEELTLDLDTKDNMIDDLIEKIKVLEENIRELELE